MICAALKQETKKKKSPLELDLENVNIDKFSSED